MYKLFILLAGIGWLVYQVYRRWARVKAAFKEGYAPEKRKKVKRGSVTIEYDPAQYPPKNFKGGDYVDFEEKS
ncbi:MAG: hypothetical protein OHK0053_04320 [Microscillaceae bacterium]